MICKIFYKFFGDWLYRKFARRNFKVLFDIPNTKKMTKPGNDSINSAIDLILWTCGPFKSRELDIDWK